MGEWINVKRHDDIHTTIVTLNRPAKRNALSFDMIRELSDVVHGLHQDHDTKLVIFTGAGVAFCAGGDLSDFHGDLNQGDALELLTPMKDVLWQITTLPMTTIAWMNGLARGGGMELATACDFRFANEAGHYGFTQGQLGISTGWGGGTLLYERISHQEAYYWLVMADVRSAPELKDIRYVQATFTDGDHILDHELIKPFVARDVEQLLHWKQQWLDARDLTRLKERMDQEVEACSHLWVSEAHRQAVAQFFNRK
ncbi:enoyl-CoA hydratase/carnithine racemase [Alkalibacillus flavidus]|uniref:Ethylmalonyl-CoA decarboxylase n=1 Tax=Alkalibacillus flavidus TaxID=546021 RepID=A0ABV2KR35_9BACI